MIKKILLLLIILPILASCSSTSDSASKEVSVCTTFSSTISAAEEAQGSLVSLNRTLGGSETQISPTPAEVFATGMLRALENAGISYEEEAFGVGMVRKWLQVVGQCLSEDTFQYFSNYID
jgi:ABC-type enterochelin transport system substrate-binding protein